MLCLLCLFQFFVRIATDVAHSKLALFGHLLALLYDILATLFRKWWYADANHLSVVLRRDAKICSKDGLLDTLQCCAIPRLDHDAACIRHGNTTHLCKRRWLAVVFDLHCIEHRCRCTARADLCELLLHVLYCFAHVLRGIIDYCCYWHGLLLHNRCNRLSKKQAAEIAAHIHVEDQYRFVVFLCHRNGRHVHHT